MKGAINVTDINGRQGDAGYQSYGRDYEVRIGKAQALKISRGYLPAMGRRTMLCEAGDSSQCGALWLDNISGQYFVRSTSWPVHDWPDVFGYRVHMIKEQ